jgi:Transposase protein
MGCTREEERIGAALGELSEASPCFGPNLDVKSAGVLVALPALLANGLLKSCDRFFKLPPGYYGLHSILLILAFVALLRIKSLEGVRYCDPGELGKVVGLDRIPEIRTLRKKLGIVCGQGDPAGWSRELAGSWLQDDPQAAGTLYVDGHVRVYHGKQTKLPRRYVSREKLCLRGVTDYWINDCQGRPFFAVSQTVNAGFLSVLREQVIPRLLDDVPDQPDSKELKTNPWLFRFSLVFDREGYSPEFFKQMWSKHRIACYTYRKYASEDWPQDEFREQEVTSGRGEISRMLLAERGVYFKSGDIWLREIRRLTASGHQTALVTTDYQNKAGDIAGRMFARWSQENFFKYMMEHYGIDRLVEYGTQEMSDTAQVVNPRYRELESKIKSQAARLSRKRAEYGALLLDEEIEEKKIQAYLRKKAELKEMIESLEQAVAELKTQRKVTAKHLLFSELPEAEQFQSLKKSGKQFLDTVKMIAYRSETALANILRDYVGKKKDEVRTLVRQIFMTDADLEVDEEGKVLRVKIHNMTNPKHHRIAQKLCEVLNETETVFPGTNLRMVYKLVANQIPADQEF